MHKLWFRIELWKYYLRLLSYGLHSFRRIIRWVNFYNTGLTMEQWSEMFRISLQIIPRLVKYAFVPSRQIILQLSLKVIPHKRHRINVIAYNWPINERNLGMFFKPFLDAFRFVINSTISLLILTWEKNLVLKFSIHLDKR